MAVDTFAAIVGRVKLHCPAAGELLPRDWVDNAWRRLNERRQWSWLIKQGQFILPALYKTGTVTVTNSSTTVTGSGTAWDGTLIGRQFRIASSTPIYTIADVPDATTITLDMAWGAQSQSGVAYQIYQAWQTAPSDFQNFIALWDTQMNWALHLNVDQQLIDTADAQRANIGNSYVVSWHDWNEVANLPRYELWPHNVTTTGYCYPFLYRKKVVDLSDGGQLPPYVRADILLEMALQQAAEWPGNETDTTQFGRKTVSNPYYDLGLAKTKAARCEFLLGELERVDDEAFLQDAQYQRPMAPWPFALPFPGDANWLQSHAV